MQRELVYVLCHLRVYVLLYLCIMSFMFKLWKCASFGTLMFVHRSIGRILVMLWWIIFIGQLASGLIHKSPRHVCSSVKHL